MRYRQKFRLLLCLAAVLACVYVLTFVFDPDLRGRRSDSYAWLDPRLRDAVDRIDFNGGDAASGREAGASARSLSLVFRNGRWLVLRGGREYPAREARVDELLDLLCRRGDYPRRSGSAASHGLFGLSGAAASRITLRGGAGLPLLDLLIGKSDAGGGSLYLRKAEGGEVRSGDGGLSVYVDNEAGSWYDLRLFETGITVNSVQRLTVIPPASGAVQDPDGGETGGEGGGPAGMPVTMVISREGNGWRIDAGDRSPDPAGLEKSRVDSYIAGILAMTGDDFVPPAQDAASGGTPPGDAALILELGDGRVLALRLGPPQEGRRQARLVELREGPPGTPAAGDYGYLLASWALDRVFRAPEYFTR